MELHVSGVEVPKLGSAKDKILRHYLIKKASKEVSKNKVMAFMALAVANLSKSPQKTLDEILRTWNDYVNQELYLEAVNEQQETDMREEFEFWRKISPKVNIRKDGGLELSVSSLKSKS